MTGMFAGLLGVLEQHARLQELQDESDRRGLAALFGVTPEEIILPHEWHS